MSNVNAKLGQTWMGHATITEFLDRYAHFYPEDSAIATGVVNAYLKRAA